MTELPHPAHEVYTNDRNLFLRSLFVPPESREKLLAAYALVVELDKIHANVSEEMIGHIRYAWWQEMLESLYAGKATQGHPVLEALVPLIASGRLPKEVLMPLVEAYRAAYPEPPPEKNAIVRDITLALIPEPQKWLKADGIIIKHQKYYGARLRGWLAVKLLLA